MKLAYNGSHAAVDVPALRRRVERGEPIEIEDNRLARLLQDQGWIDVKEDSDNGDGS